MRVQRHQKMAAGFTQSKANAEIEDKGRLPNELAAEISRVLDAGLRIQVPGWGRYAIRPLGVSRYRIARSYRRMVLT